MYVCTVCVHICVCMYVRTCMYLCIFMYCMYVPVCIYVYLCTVCMSVRMYVQYVYVYVYVCMYLYIFMYIYILYVHVGQNCIVIVLGANLLLSSEDLSAAEEVIAGAKVLICQLEIEHEITLKALQLGKKHGGMVYIQYGIHTYTGIMRYIHTYVCIYSTYVAYGIHTEIYTLRYMCVYTT